MEADIERDKQEKQNIIKKFGLERKQLKAKGLTNQEIDRIYRGLFIYSFGFYEMLLESIKHSNDTKFMMAQIWKVYGILLEYCARSNFTTTVNEI